MQIDYMIGKLNIYKERHYLNIIIYIKSLWTKDITTSFNIDSKD